MFHAKIFISQGCEEPQGYLSREYGNCIEYFKSFFFFSFKITHYLFERLINTSINGWMISKERHDVKQCLPRLLNCNVTPSSEFAQQICCRNIIKTIVINDDDLKTLSIFILINIFTSFFYSCSNPL